jgi:SAM-dependent methyltransferase
VEIIDGLRANTSKGTIGSVRALLERGPRGSVLDAPAGTGAMSKILRDLGFEVTALEIDRDLFRVEGVGVVSADMNRGLPFPDASFDHAVCVDGIEHLENPYFTVREFERVLRPGGRLVFSTPNISAFRSRFRFLMTGHHNKGKTPLPEESPTPLDHINLLTFSECRYALHRAGFAIESVVTNRVKAASYPYALLYPLAALTTAAAFRHEKDPRQRDLNRGIYRQLLSWPVAMGETLIVEARKTASGDA